MFLHLRTWMSWYNVFMFKIMQHLDLHSTVDYYSGLWQKTKYFPCTFSLIYIFFCSEFNKALESK